MRDNIIIVRQGGETVAVKEAKRLNAPHNDQWRITVNPGSKADMTVAIRQTASCTATGAVCSDTNEQLSNQLSKTIKGPPGLSVADASVAEAAEATVDFTVTLSRAASDTVTVRYATSEGTATAGLDYTSTSGTLTFAPDETSKTVQVPVLDDAIDDGGGQFTLTLSNPAGGGVYLADASATGTIENNDPMPQAWLARFGRTIATQAVDAIGGRMSGAGGAHVTVGGQSLSLQSKSVGPDGGAALASDLDRHPPTDMHSRSEESRGAPRTMKGREVLLGSSFQLSAGGETGGAAWTAWGRFATDGYDAAEDGTRMNGRVTTGFLGADVGGARWLAGVALSVSEGNGDYTLMEGDDSGDFENTLMAVYPYARLGVSDKVDVWGLAGYGAGELTLAQHPETDRARSYETDIGMRMGAIGVRGEVYSPKALAGLSVAVKSDAFWVRKSDAVSGLEGSDADVNRVRLLVEGSLAFAAGGGTFTPSLEVGVRHDGGDAETGAGVEAGAGLRYTVGVVTVAVSGRTLIAHEETGYEEWGASGTVRIDPGASGRGLSLSVSPTWGASASGVYRLWSLADTRGLARDVGFAADRRLEAELGYGLCLGREPGVLTPFAGFSHGHADTRAWRAGARWQVAYGAALSLEGLREEAGYHVSATGAAVHGVMLRGSIQW